MALLWTEPGDVTGRWIGEPLTATDSQITTLLTDAEDTVLREFPDLIDRVVPEGETPPEGTLNPIPILRVKKVIARIVIRHLRNPSGERSRMDVAGPFTQNVVYGGDSPGALYLTDEDRAELGGTHDDAAFMIDTMPAYTGPSSPEGWLAYGRTWR